MPSPRVCVWALRAHTAPCLLAAPFGGRGSAGAAGWVWRPAGCLPHGRLTGHSPPSSGPQSCAACVQEGIYEEGVSILESSSVSEPSAPCWPRQEGVAWPWAWGSWRGAHPRAALSPGVPGQCCPQGGGEPAGSLSQRGLLLEGDPEGVRGRGCLAPAPPPRGRGSCRWAGRTRGREWGARRLRPSPGVAGRRGAAVCVGPGLARAPHGRGVSLLTAGLVLSPR